MSRDRVPTILVVEDQEPVRRLIVSMLARGGFKTIEAGNGVRALELYEAAQERISLAIIDMIMPRMSGLDVAAELGRQDPELKILYISSYASSIAIDSIQRRAPEFLLLKPFTERGLVDRVVDLLAAPGGHSTAIATPEPA